MAAKHVKAKPKTAAAKVVAATGFSSGGGDPMWTSREIDEVMSDAVMEAMAAGIPLDSPKMGKAMQAAVEEFKSVRQTAAAGKKK